MFLPPKQAKVDMSGGAFASTRINGASKGLQKLNPASTIGLSGINSVLPIEKDSFVGGFLDGFSSAFTNPITTTNGRQKLAAVDPFAKVVNSPQNQLSSILSNYFGKPGAVIGGIIENEPLRKVTSEFIRTGKVDSETSKAFLKNFSGNILAGVTEASAPFMKDIQDQIGLTGVDSKQLISSMMGIDGAPRIEDVLSQNPTISMIVKGKEYFANADFSSTNGIFKVIDNLTSNTALSSLFDLKTEFAIFNVITKSLMVFDAPDLFSKVGDWFRNDDNTSASNNREIDYYLDNLDNAVENSSMTFLEGLLTRVPPSKILDTNRNFVADFLESFTLKYDKEPTAAIGIRLNAIMTQIDPNWAKAQLIPGKGTYVSDLKPFKLMSDDACRVFQLAGLYQTELVIANYYSIKPIKDYMKSLYPFAMI